MTNNDKALSDIKRAKDFVVSYGISGALSDDVPSIEIAMVEMTLRELIDKALTPQSSADLGAVRELLQFSANGCLVPPDGGSPTIQDHIDTAKEALRILDEVIGRAE